MKHLRQIILTGILGAVAMLPFWALYRLADVTFLLLFHVVRYRRKIVESNIAGSFPDKSVGERRRISRQFYRNFADYIFETLKLRHISDSQIKKRMKFENIGLVERYIAQGRPVIAYFAHTGNWEWATSVKLWSGVFDNAVLGQVYRPLKNDFANRYMLRLRSRFNTTGYPKATVFRELLRHKMNGVISFTGFMSDQKPSHGDRVHILRFLNRPTAVITGTETAARRLEAAAVYWDMSKTARGRYVITMRPIADNVAETEEYFATDCYFRLLEQTITREPSIWLWSHNRWKHPVTMPI